MTTVFRRRRRARAAVRFAIGVVGLTAVIWYGQFGGAAAVPGQVTFTPAGAAQPLPPGGVPQTGGVPQPGAVPQTGVVPQPGVVPQTGVVPQPGAVPQPGVLPQPGIVPQAATVPGTGAPPATAPGTMGTLRQVQADLATVQQIMTSVQTLANGQAGPRAGTAQQTPAACTQGVAGVLQPVQAELQADLGKLQQLPAQVLADPLGFVAMEVGDVLGLVQKELAEVQAVIGGCQQPAVAGQVAASTGLQTTPQGAATLTMDQVQKLLADQVAQMQAAA